MAAKKNVSNFLDEQPIAEKGDTEEAPETPGDELGGADDASTSSPTPRDTLDAIAGTIFTYLKFSKYLRICFLGGGETSVTTDLDELDLDHEEEGVSDLEGEESKLVYVILEDLIYIPIFKSSCFL